MPIGSTLVGVFGYTYMHPRKCLSLSSFVDAVPDPSPVRLLEPSGAASWAGAQLAPKIDETSCATRHSRTRPTLRQKAHLPTCTFVTDKDLSCFVFSVSVRRRRAHRGGSRLRVAFQLLSLFFRGQAAEHTHCMLRKTRKRLPAGRPANAITFIERTNCSLRGLCDGQCLDLRKIVVFSFRVVSESFLVPLFRYFSCFRFVYW